jgi:NTP pyrophosphatase (non-canonical NTP hydrolase)
MNKQLTLKDFPETKGIVQYFESQEKLRKNKEGCLNNYAIQIRKICDEHGFYWNVKNPKDIATLLLLMHSEISEATEALRDEKYEEVKLEIIGLIIRALHLLQLLNTDIDKLLQSEIIRNQSRPYKHGRKLF